MSVFLEHEHCIKEAFSTLDHHKPDNQGTFNNQTQAEGVWVMVFHLWVRQVYLSFL